MQFYNLCFSDATVQGSAFQDMRMLFSNAKTENHSETKLSVESKVIN